MKLFDRNELFWNINKHILWIIHTCASVTLLHLRHWNYNLLLHNRTDNLQHLLAGKSKTRSWWLKKYKGTKEIITRMHSSRMRTARSLPYGWRGGSLSRGVSGESLFSGSLCLVGGLCLGGLRLGGLCPGESVQWEVSVWGVSVLGVSVQGGLCPVGGLCTKGVSVQGRSLSLGPCPGGVSVRVVSVQGWGWGSLSEGGLPDRDPLHPVNRITDACENITLPQLRCGG